MRELDIRDIRVVQLEPEVAENGGERHVEFGVGEAVAKISTLDNGTPLFISFSS